MSTDLGFDFRIATSGNGPACYVYADLRNGEIGDRMFGPFPSREAAGDAIAAAAKGIAARRS